MLGNHDVNVDVDDDVDVDDVDDVDDEDVDDEDDEDDEEKKEKEKVSSDKTNLNPNWGTTKKQKALRKH